jgi:hypothetical protein
MLEVDEKEFERVREFKYLESAVTEVNTSNIAIKIKQRTVMANGASYGLKKQLSARYLGRQIKCSLCDTFVRLVLTEVNADP